MPHTLYLWMSYQICLLTPPHWPKSILVLWSIGTTLSSLLPTPNTETPFRIAWFRFGCETFCLCSVCQKCAITPRFSNVQMALLWITWFLRFALAPAGKPDPQVFSYHSTQWTNEIGASTDLDLSGHVPSTRLHTFRNNRGMAAGIVSIKNSIG